MVDSKSSEIKSENGTSMHLSFWVGFQHILLFISLYIFSISFTFLIHALVDKYIPATVSSDLLYGMRDSSFYKNIILMQMSALIVSYPLFAYFFLLISKKNKENPEFANLKSRTRMIYLTLIVTFIILIAKVIFTVWNFLTGNISANFLAHLAVTVSANLLIFCYYLNEVRTNKRVLGFQKAFITILTIAVVAVTIVAMQLTGTPVQIKSQNDDNLRINRIDKIRYAIERYWEDTKNLPRNLSELNQKTVSGSDSYFYSYETDTKDILIDPISKREFEYKIMGDSNYELCTEFATNGEKSGSNNDEYFRYSPSGKSDYKHDKGYDCIALSIPEYIMHRLDKTPWATAAPMLKIEKK